MKINSVLDIINKDRQNGGKLYNYLQKDTFYHISPGSLSFAPEEAVENFRLYLKKKKKFSLWFYFDSCPYLCKYCNFNVQRLVCNSKQTEKIVEYLLNEASLWLDKIPELKKFPLNSFAFLGGSPSMISSEGLQKIIELVERNFRLKKGIEMSIEGCPDTYTPSKIDHLVRLGFNQFMMGVQTFDDKLLALAGRRHTKKDVLAAINYLVKKKGTTRISADLIYGLPGQTEEGFLQDVKTLINLGVDTIVLCRLHLGIPWESENVVEKIRLAYWQTPVGKKEVERIGLPRVEEKLLMFEKAYNLLKKAGFILRHRPMFFVKKGRALYQWRQDEMWHHLPFLGIGRGIYSLTKNMEIYNYPRTDEYLLALKRGNLPIESVSGHTVFEEARRWVEFELLQNKPLSNKDYQKRYPQLPSLFESPWKNIFVYLQKIGVIKIDKEREVINCTPQGEMIIDAVLACYIHPLSFQDDFKKGN